MGQTHLCLATSHSASQFGPFDVKLRVLHCPPLLVWDPSPCSEVVTFNLAPVALPWTNMETTSYAAARAPCASAAMMLCAILCTMPSPRTTPVFDEKNGSGEIAGTGLEISSTPISMMAIQPTTVRNGLTVKQATSNLLQQLSVKCWSYNAKMLLQYLSLSPGENPLWDALLLLTLFSFHV